MSDLVKLAVVNVMNVPYALLCATFGSRFWTVSQTGSGTVTPCDSAIANLSRPNVY